MTHATGLIAPAECELYRASVEDHYTGEGRIVDAGCFTGKSTVALCSAIEVRRSGRRVPVVALDRFVATDSYLVEHFAEHGLDIRMGESYLDLFLDRIAPYRDLVEVRCGELLQAGRMVDPIDVLVVDIAKSPASNVYILRHWFPLLRPKVSIVIHQDFHAPTQHWIASSMGALLDWFDVGTPRTGESASFLLRRPLTPQALASASAHPFHPDAVDRIGRVAEAIPTRCTGALRLMQCVLLHRLGQGSRAVRILEGVLNAPETHGGDKWQKWLGMTISLVAPSMFRSDERTMAAYFEHGFRKSGY